MKTVLNVIYHNNSIFVQFPDKVMSNKTASCLSNSQVLPNHECTQVVGRSHRTSFGSEKTYVDNKDDSKSLTENNSEPPNIYLPSAIPATGTTSLSEQQKVDTDITCVACAVVTGFSGGTGDVTPRPISAFTIVGTILNTVTNGLSVGFTSPSSTPNTAQPTRCPPSTHRLHNSGIKVTDTSIVNVKEPICVVLTSGAPTAGVSILNHGGIIAVIATENGDSFTATQSTSDGASFKSTFSVSISGSPPSTKKKNRKFAIRTASSSATGSAGVPPGTPVQGTSWNYNVCGILRPQRDDASRHLSLYGGAAKDSLRIVL